jgi:hypothetical protein
VSRNTRCTDFVETLGRKSSCNTHISNKVRLGTSEHVLKMMKPIGENLDYCMTGRVIPTFLLLEHSHCNFCSRRECARKHTLIGTTYLCIPLTFKHNNSYPSYSQGCHMCLKQQKGTLQQVYPPYHCKYLQAIFKPEK